MEKMAGVRKKGNRKKPLLLKPLYRIKFNFVRRITPIVHALLAANPSCREALGTRAEAAWTPWCSINEKLPHFLPFYEEKCKNNVIFCRCCLRNTYLLLLWFLRADFVAEVVGKYCWILLKWPSCLRILKRWPLKLKLYEAVHRLDKHIFQNIKFWLGFKELSF